MLVVDLLAEEDDALAVEPGESRPVRKVNVGRSRSKHREGLLRKVNSQELSVRGGRTSVGWHYLSNTTCLMWPHSLSTALLV